MNGSTDNTFLPGKMYRSRELHEKFGGHFQVAIGPRRGSFSRFKRARDKDPLL
jgi:hypothetical protein